MKLEQRLIELSKKLGKAREDGDQQAIEDLEDRIDEVQYEIEEEYERRHGTDWDD